MKEEGVMIQYNNLLFMNLAESLEQLRWRQMETVGQPPTPRFSHAMTIIPSLLSSSALDSSSLSGSSNSNEGSTLIVHSGFTETDFTGNNPSDPNLYLLHLPISPSSSSEPLSWFLASSLLFLFSSSMLILSYSHCCRLSSRLFRRL